MYRRLARPIQFPLADQSEIVTRTVSKIKFHIQLPRVERYKAYPFYAGVLLWDRLSSDLQHNDSYPLFKSKINEWLLSQNYITKRVISDQGLMHSLKAHAMISYADCESFARLLILCVNAPYTLKTV